MNELSRDILIGPRDRSMILFIVRHFLSSGYLWGCLLPTIARGRLVRGRWKPRLPGKRWCADRIQQRWEEMVRIRWLLVSELSLSSDTSIRKPAIKLAKEKRSW